jgi:peptidoglycan biosynthesis protein MviN/MurJ (putative lipid II flippase)
MQAPVRVVGQTTATAALPTLSKLVAEARWEELSSLVLRTLQAAVGLGILAGAATFALADPFVRPFYARRDFWRPMLLGTAIALLAIPLYLVLGPPFGARGLAGAGALAITANALATLVLARRLHGAPRFGPLASTALRAILIALPAAAAAFYCQPGLGGGIGALVDLAVGGIVFALLAIAGALVVGDAPMREMLSEAWGSLARRRRAA